MVELYAEGGNHESAAPAARGYDAGFSRTLALYPGAEQRRGRSEHDEEQRVHPPERADLPVGGGRARDADRSSEREPEHAESVGHPDREMNRQRGRRDEPPVESGRGDNPILREQTGRQSSLLIRRRAPRARRS